MRGCGAVMGGWRLQLGLCRIGGGSGGRGVDETNGGFQDIASIDDIGVVPTHKDSDVSRVWCHGEAPSR